MSQKEIYVVERGIEAKYCEYDYDNCYYSTTFERAVEYIKSYCNYTDNEMPEIKKVNHRYWECRTSYDVKYGILKEKLDDEFYWEKQDGDESTN